MRFVPVDPDAVVECATLNRFVTLSCSEETAHTLRDGLAEGSFDTWDRPHRDICQGWDHATDPTHVAVPIRQLFREAG